jgi:transcriptional regulator with XRE-family HTH domain
MTESDKLTYRSRLEKVIPVVLAGTRNDLDVSQKELAMRLGWTRSVVANLETGRRSTQLTDFILLAKALNIDPIVLLRRVLQWC